MYDPTFGHFSQSSMELKITKLVESNFSNPFELFIFISISHSKYFLCFLRREKFKYSQYVNICSVAPLLLMVWNFRYSVEVTSFHSVFLLMWGAEACECQKKRNLCLSRMVGGRMLWQSSACAPQKCILIRSCLVNLIPSGQGYFLSPW